MESYNNIKSLIGGHQILLNNKDYINNSMHKYILKCKLIYSSEDILFSIKLFSITKKKKLINLVIKIINRLNLIHKDFKEKYNINITKKCFIIYDCPNKKYMIDNKYYINGGFTNILSNNIFIYRFSELPKVILHEYIHHALIYKLSDQIYYNDPLHRYIRINYNEAIVEFLATIYQCKFTNTLIKDEIKYNKKIAEYVLGIELLNKTNIYSYIIIKYILMINYENIIKNILNHEYIYNYIDNYKLKLKPKKTKKKEFMFVSCGNL